MIALCNEHILILKYGIKKAQETEDIKTLAKLEGHMLAYIERLQYAIHQNFQQGRTSQDVTTVSKKNRYNA